MPSKTRQLIDDPDFNSINNREKRTLLESAIKQDMSTQGISDNFDQNQINEIINKYIGSTPEKDYGEILPDPTIGETLLSAGKNFPSSMKGQIQDVIDTAKDLPGAAKSMYGMVSGLVEKAIPGEQAHEKNIDAVGEYLSNRYGNWDQLKQTIANDPASLMADLATILNIAGGSAKIAGKISKVGSLGEASKTSGLLQKLGEATQKTGASIDPLNVMIAGAKLPAKGVSKLLPQNVIDELYMQSAKFNPSLGTDKLKQITKTALDEGIEPTLKGQQKLQSKIYESDIKIEDIMSKLSDRNATTDINDLFKYLPDLEDKMAMSGDVKRIKNVEKQIGDQIQRKATKNETTKYDPTKRMSAEDVQQLKRRLYKETGNYYEKLKRPSMAEAKQEVARAAKDALEIMYPEIKDVNKKWGEYIELMNEIDNKSAGRIANRDILDFGIVSKTGLGGALGGTFGLITGAGLSILEKPKVKAKTAILLNKLKNKKSTARPRQKSMYTLPERIDNQEKANE